MINLKEQVRDHILDDFSYNVHEEVGSKIWHYISYLLWEKLWDTTNVQVQHGIEDVIDD